MKASEKLPDSLIRVSNGNPIEPGMENENLYWEMMQRLRSTCIPTPARFIVLTMCRFTTMEERNYFGGLELIQQVTNYSERTVRKHIAILTESGIVDGKILRKFLYMQHMRQNYHLALPPKDIITCAEWEGHNETKSHKKEYRDFLANFQRTSLLIENEWRENEPEAFAIEQTGEVVIYPDWQS